VNATTNNHMALKSATAREYRSKHPDKPSLALARVMYNKNKALFKDVEDARSSLRYVEGKQGEKCRKKIADKSLLLTEARPYNPYNLPGSDETTYEPYEITGYKKAAIINDVHAPYHSISAITAFIAFAKKQKIDLLVINGDFWDFYGLSRFLKDPRKRRFAEEISIGIKLLHLLQKELKCKLIFKPGNHDDRFIHYLWQKLGEIDQLADLEEIKDLTIESIVRKRAPGLDIDFVDTKQVIKIGDLNIVHGHEFATSIMSPVNIARGLYLRAKASTMCGHHHRSSEHTEMNIEGKIVTTWSVGSLCELHPEYMPLNSWNHGFAIVEIEENGKDFQVFNKRIFNQRVL
jgi:predicted phosphodiesterase